ncbi:hypothetical protein A1O3_09453 [Capronia epimyces CBS 606.96]|uniref:Uncharacterized protein n=1 Tax=Capronia epimyces CBS 606.96 TaxID=1182542 RepID=W9XCS4_9EURO|nr:uncharacterized protein A1O3_09453 [Capronia epimyces CBS 606.96]EXJ78292.1 hypothetical protein A1O3_09453 [Capronia epimyces CBS 606.96]
MISSSGPCPSLSLLLRIMPSKSLRARTISTTAVYSQSLEEVAHQASHQASHPPARPRVR